jgi:hypothetical protein
MTVPTTLEMIFFVTQKNTQAFPNGHRRFLTKSSLKKLNDARLDAVDIEHHPLNPIESPWLTQQQKQQAPTSSETMTAEKYNWKRVPVPMLVGESLKRKRLPIGITSATQRGVALNNNNNGVFVSISSWASEPPSLLGGSSETTTRFDWLQVGSIFYCLCFLFA